MTTMVVSKSIFQSKTFWINVITAVVMMITALADSSLIKDNPQVFAAVMMVNNFLNIALRYLSSQPVTTMGGDVKAVKG